jgi:hypothetical protein
MVKLLQKKIRFFRGEAIGTDFLFDYDIEIFVDLNNEIADCSGCGYKTAKKLLTKI